MPYCKVGQAEVFYEEIGKGKPILMIHGFSLDHRVMKGCMEPVFAKRDGWRRIYIDLPGMGLTKGYDNIKDSDSMLETVIDVIQALIPNENYAIVGESYGGYIARGIIEKQPAMVTGAAFICPLIKPLPETRSVDEHVVLRRDEQLLAELLPGQIESFINNNVILNEYTWSRYNEEIVSGSEIGDTEFLEKIKQNYAFTFEVDQMEFVKPSLFLTGKQDANVGYQDAFEILPKYPRSTFAALDMAGHNLQIEQPVLFNALVNEWLDRVEEQAAFEMSK
jgi:pimeloyl-ACP methyl ester carboxylesterase